MAEKKKWKIAWREIQQADVMVDMVWHNPCSLKEMYDLLNEWNKEAVVNDHGETYYLIGEANG